MLCITLKKNNNLPTVIYHVSLSNTNNLLTAVWYQVFQSNTNNGLKKLFVFKSNHLFADS